MNHYNIVVTAFTLHVSWKINNFRLFITRKPLRKTFCANYNILPFRFNNLLSLKRNLFAKLMISGPNVVNVIRGIVAERRTFSCGPFISDIHDAPKRRIQFDVGRDRSTTSTAQTPRLINNFTECPFS